MFNKRAQSTAEYAIIIGVVVGAIMAVGVFLRGGIEAKVRHQTNLYLEQSGSPSKFATDVLQSDYTTESTSQTDIKQQTTMGTKSEIYYGGGSEDGAKTKGFTKRTGKTTFFGK